MDLLDDDRLLDLRPRARRTDPAAVLQEERSRAVRLPEANAALRDWTRPAEPQQSSVTESCAVCGTRPSRGTCPACGLGVCTADVQPLLGLCRTCAARAP